MSKRNRGTLQILPERLLLVILNAGRLSRIGILIVPVFYYPALILTGRLPIQHDSEAVLINWIPFLKGLYVSHSIPSYIPNYSFGITNYFTLFQDPVSIFLITSASLFKIQNLILIFCVYILALNIAITLMIRYICSELAINRYLYNFLIWYILLINSPTWGYNFNYRLSLSIVIIIFSLIYLNEKLTIIRLFRVLILNFSFIIYGQLSYVITFVYLNLVLLLTPFLIAKIMSRRWFPIRSRRKKFTTGEKIETTFSCILLLCFSGYLLFLNVTLRDATVVAPGRTINGEVPLQDILSYGGNLGWQKYLTLFGPYKRIIQSATPDFGLEGVFLILPMVLLGVLKFRIMKKSSKLFFLGLLLAISFVSLVALPYEPLVRILVEVVPYFDQVRHLAYTSSSLLVLISIVATLVLSENYHESLMVSETQQPRNKRAHFIHKKNNFFVILYLTTVSYALFSPLLFHLLNIAFPRLLGLYPTKEFLCGVKSMAEFNSTLICKYIYMDWRSKQGSFFGSHSIIDVEKWKIMTGFILLSVLVLALGKKFKRNLSKRTQLSSNTFGNKWLGALLVLVFGSGIMNYQYSNRIWQGSPFGTKGFTLSSNFETVYEPLPTSLENGNLFKEKHKVILVNDQTMISIYENLPTCSSKRRIDLVQSEITRMQVKLRRVTDLNLVDLFDVVCNVINDEFGKEYSVLKSGLEVIPPSRTDVDYNYLKTEFELSPGIREQNFVWSSVLPYDKYWKLHVNGVAVELKNDESGFLTSRFSNRDSKVLIELERDPKIVYLYATWYFGHLLTFFLFSFLLIKVFRRTRIDET